MHICLSESKTKTLGDVISFARFVGAPKACLRHNHIIWLWHTYSRQGFGGIKYRPRLQDYVSQRKYFFRRDEQLPRIFGGLNTILIKY